MTTDTQSVQTTEPASKVEPVSLVAPVEPAKLVEAVKPPEPPKTVTLEEAKLQQMIIEAAEKAAQKAAAEAKEIGKRELQSAQDRNKAEMLRIQRRASIAENTLNAARKKAETLDPDIAKEFELEAYREKDRGMTQMEREEEALRAQAAFHQRFKSSLTQFITDSGVDPTDKRIDWAEDAPDYIEAQTRVLGSVARLQKEQIQLAQSKLEKRLQEVESKFAKVNVEANSVSTATSTGVVAGSDEEFIKKFASGDLPLTKANVERAKKIQANY